MIDTNINHWLHLSLVIVTMSDTEEREQTATAEESAMATETESEADSETESEIDSETNSETDSDTEEREQTGESQPDDAERQKKLNKKLLKAALAGNNEDFIQHISDGAEITSTDWRGDTGFHLSALKGHKDVMLTFITHKLDINIRGKEQWTPLMHAAAGGQLSSVQLLLAHGADIDLRDETGHTALIMAAGQSYTDIIGELLSHGADDQIQDEDGWNALSFAEEEYHQDAIRMLTAWKEKSIDKEMMTAIANGNWRLVTSLTQCSGKVVSINFPT